MRFQRLLVPVDGSEPSDAAIDLAVTLARESKGEIALVHAFDAVGEVAMAAHANLGLTEEVARDNARAVLEAASSRLKDSRVAHTTMTVEGNVVDSVLDAAKKWKADAIVVGSHGRSGISRALLGSVSEGIARRSEIPVVMVHRRS